jgi:4-diphosphocytidyl-2-C-methyl-D-erythritol kinase
LLITFPNCKINFGLNVLRKRNDGFHDLETIFYPVFVNDILEIIPAIDNKTGLTVTGLSAGKEAENLCIKAWHIVKNDYPELPGIKIHLHKIIPLGAGLGGGSADAAFALQLINKTFQLNVPESKFFEYALQLGSDCPFFLLNKPCFASGRGEIIEPLDISLKDYKVLLIHPGIHINTGEAFKEITHSIPPKKIKEIIQQPAETWKNELQNDFENFAFKKYPVLKKIKNELYESGALFASMSGSGSTIFGVFNKQDNINYPSLPGYFYKVIDLT